MIHDYALLKDETVYVLCCGNWIAHVSDSDGKRQSIHFFAKKRAARAACLAFNQRYPERCPLHVRQLRLHSLGFKEAA